MTYTVKYLLAGQWYWRTIKKVKGDLVPSDLDKSVRVFILDDESRIEIPMSGTQFKFSKERFISIKQSAEKESGQTLRI